MADNADGPVFRANKRRKVFRRRAERDDNEDEPGLASEDPVERSFPSNEQPSRYGDDASSRPEVGRLRQTKRHGIAFSSSDRSSSRPQHKNEETAVTIAEPPAVAQANGRFARQTGKAIVEDDKHMSAYIDSKLAEMRSSASTLNSAIQHSQSLEPQRLDLTQTLPCSISRDSTPLSPSHPSYNNQVGTITTTAAAAAAPPARPTAPTQKPTSTRHHRRPPRQPSPSTQARASLIDQIMRESNHTPHYTSANTTSSTSTTNDHDPDAAAAAAFKADFLAQAEARNLSRRQPAANASATAAVPSGPKLGGSRAQRERMKAAEEAKAKK